MTWLKYVAPLIQLAIAVARIFVKRNERRIGHLEAEAAQAKRDLKQLRRAADARRAAGNSIADRMRTDPRNRDAH